MPRVSHAVVALTLLAAAALGASWTQALPKFTLLDVVNIASDGQTVVTRSGSNSGQPILPQIATTSWPLGANSTFSFAVMPELELDVDAFGLVAIEGGFVATTDRAPNSGLPTTFVLFSPPNGLGWELIASIAETSAGLLRSDGASALLMAPDVAVSAKGRGSFSFSADGGHTWASTASPFSPAAKGEFVVDVVAGGPDGSWAVFSYDLDGDMRYGYSLFYPSNGSFVNVTLPVTRAPSSDAAVFAVMPALTAGSWVFALTNPDASTMDFYQADSLSNPSFGWKALASIGLADFPNEDAAVSVALCESTGLGALLYSNGNGPHGGFVQTTADGFATYAQSTFVNSAQAVVAFGPGKSCAIAQIGAGGVAASTSDGEAWVAVNNGYPAGKDTSNAASFFDWWWAALWSPAEGLFGAFAQSTLVSPDGLNWAASPLPRMVAAFLLDPSSTRVCGMTTNSFVCAPSLMATAFDETVTDPNGIVGGVYGNGVYVYADAASVGAQLHTSTSMTATFVPTYTAHGSELSQVPIFTSIDFAQGAFWAFAQNNLPSPATLVSSTDGKTWATVSHPSLGCSSQDGSGFVGGCASLALWACVGASSTSFSVYTGSSWKSVLTAPLSGTNQCQNFECSETAAGYVLTLAVNAYVSQTGASWTEYNTQMPGAGLNPFTSIFASSNTSTIALGRICTADPGGFVFVQSNGE